jgi:uncharacterized repeat protein (TIGR01451 family)
MTNASPWSPPGIAGPWPHDEYLCDGGDREVQANIGPNENLRGLELEDTVAVYETVDGDTLIEPSNRVCLYAPRFGAVRQVSGVVQTEQREQPVGFERPVAAKFHQDDQLATTAVQPVQPVGEIGRKQPSIERVGESAVPATSRQPIVDLTGGFATYENLLVMRTGIITDREKAQLIESIDAAIVWSHDKAVQVVLDGRAAVDVTGDQKAQATFRIDEPDNAALRVIKVASTKVAKPGDVVDFTIRFDNLGDTTIKHLVLVDNLSARHGPKQPPGRVLHRGERGRVADAEVGLPRSAACWRGRPGAVQLPREIAAASRTLAEARAREGHSRSVSMFTPLPRNGCSCAGFSALAVSL